MIRKQEGQTSGRRGHTQRDQTAEQGHGGAQDRARARARPQQGAEHGGTVPVFTRRQGDSLKFGQIWAVGPPGSQSA